MELVIKEIPCLTECDNALFLFQAFKIERIEFIHIEEVSSFGKTKVYLNTSGNSELNTSTSLSNDGLVKELAKLYQDFYHEIERYKSSFCYILLDNKLYEEWFEITEDKEDVLKEIEKDIVNIFSKSQLTYMPNDLIYLIGRSIGNKNFFETMDELHLLQAKRNEYEFLDKAPMDIGLTISAGTIIMGVQVYLWNRIGIALNTYYYSIQYSSYFWTFGISIILFSLIILLLLIPLFFSLRSGFKDLIKWCKIKHSRRILRKVK